MYHNYQHSNFELEIITCQSENANRQFRFEITNQKKKLALSRHTLNALTKHKDIYQHIERIEVMYKYRKHIFKVDLK